MFDVHNDFYLTHRTKPIYVFSHLVTCQCQHFWWLLQCISIYDASAICYRGNLFSAKDILTSKKTDNLIARKYFSRCPIFKLKKKQHFVCVCAIMNSFEGLNKLLNEEKKKKLSLANKRNPLTKCYSTSINYPQFFLCRTFKCSQEWKVKFQHSMSLMSLTFVFSFHSLSRKYFKWLQKIWFYMLSDFSTCSYRNAISKFKSSHFSNGKQLTKIFENFSLSVTSKYISFSNFLTFMHFISRRLLLSQRAWFTLHLYFRVYVLEISGRFTGNL